MKTTNEIIHEFMGGCPHLNMRRLVLHSSKRAKFDEPFAYTCRDCHQTSASETGTVPDYTSDESPRSLLREVVDKVKADIGIAALNRKLLDFFVSDYAREVAVLNLPAAQIAEAVAATIKGMEVKSES